MTATAQIDRRSFLAGAVASVAAVATPAAALAALPPRDPFARVAALQFSRDPLPGIGHRAIRRFMWASAWRFDSDSYPDHPLVQHEASGVTFLIEEDSYPHVHVRRLFLASDPPALSHERYLLIGHAAQQFAGPHWHLARRLGPRRVEYRMEPYFHLHLAHAPPLTLDA